MTTYKKETPIEEGELAILSSRYTNLISASNRGSVFVVTQAYVANLPGIAAEVYHKQEYWRVLMWVNGIRDPINHVTLGIRLRIPPIEAVHEHFLKPRNKIGMQ